MPAASRVVAFLDLGTNSVRLLLCRLHENGPYAVLSSQKEMIRLGAGEFQAQELQPEAMARAALVCRKFVDMARENGSAEMVAVATSATREARNQAEFLKRLKTEAGLDLRVISGQEEARLIYLGVSSGINLEGRTALFIDIGGGSTEVIVGDARGYLFLDSLKLGAVRLSNLYLADHKGPVSAKRYQTILKQARNTAVRVVQRLRQFPFDLAVGSSGTIENLAEIAANTTHKGEPERKSLLRYKDLKAAVELLCSLPLKERRKVPGINPARADIIIAGAAILDALMTDLGLKEIRVSERGLRDGLLVDYLAREQSGAWSAEKSVRELSVQRLGRACGFDEAHHRAVSRLALSLFDSGKEIGLHRLGDEERELLALAGLLHDVGAFLSYTNHHAHSYYFIKNAELLGFSQAELSIMAATALFHRKVIPRPRHPEFAALPERGQEVVSALCIFLRIAESLDRSHAGLVSSARFTAGGQKTVLLTITAKKDCELELWGVQNHESAFEKTFGRQMVIAAKVEEESKK